MAAATYDQVQQLYIAYFGRPADPTGQAFWANTIDQANGSIAAVLAGFSASAESQALFGNKSTIDKVTAIYQNAFNRAPEAAGLAYWVNQIDSGKVTQAQASWTIQQSAGAGDAAAVQNKLTAAKAFTAQIDTTAEIQGYQGTAAAQVARDFLQTVNSSNATATAAVANAASVVANVVAVGGTPGSAFTLATGVDNITGTAGNDTVNGTLINNEAAAAGTGTTYQVSDIIDGGAGSDTLALLVAGSNSTVNTLAQNLGSVTNVENLSVKNLSTGSAGGVSINAAGATALTAVTNNGSTAAVAVTGVQNNAAVNVSNSNAGTSVTFADGKVTTGVTVNVSSAGTATNIETVTLATTAAAGTATTATINATGSNFVTLAGGAAATTSIGAANGIKTLTVTGSGSLNLTNTSALVNGSTLAVDLTTLDASANTGGVTATVSSTNAAGVTVKGGSGADVITVGGALAAGANITLGAGNDKLLNNGGSIAASNASKTTVIDAGDGIDTLAASLVTAGNGSVFKNFDILSLGGASVDASLLTGSTLTGLSVDVSTGGSFTYSNLTPTLGLTDTFVGNNSANTTTLSFTTASVAGTSDSYSITFAGAAQTTAPTATNVQLGTVAAAGIENFNIVSGGGANTWNSLTLGADTSARTVTVTGAQNLDVAFAANFGEVNGTNNTVGVSSIDGSAATGKLAINLSNVVQATAGLTVKGGAGADTITTSTSAATLTGGAGADTFVVGATVYGAGKNITTITDAVAGDKITLADQGTETFQTAKVDVSTAQTLNAALGVALSNTDGSTNGAIKWFQYAGNTYIVESKTANLVVTDAAVTDVVVKLTGLVDLSTAAGAGTNTLTLV